MLGVSLGRPKLKATALTNCEMGWFWAVGPVQQTNKNRREIFRSMKSERAKMRQIEKRVGFRLSRLLRRRHLRRRRFSWEYPSAVGKNLSETLAPRVIAA